MMNEGGSLGVEVTYMLIFNDFDSYPMHMSVHSPTPR